MNYVKGTVSTKEVEAEQLGNHIGEEVWLHGSIYRIRKMSGFAFVIIRTKRMLVQCVYTENESMFSLADFAEECCVRVLAQVVAEERSRSGYDLHLLKMELLSNPAEILPVVINHKKVEASLETVLDYRPITLRNDKERAVFRIQEGIMRGFRRFLEDNHFVEIHTPKIVAEGAEGGANIFRLAYFGKEAYLAQSPQFYKQMMTGVYERVFEVGPVFRAEKHDTARHLNEYTSVDFEMAYLSGYQEIMEMETMMLRSAMEYLQEYYMNELTLLNVNVPQIEKIPFVSFKEAKEMVSKRYKRKIKDYYDFEPEEEKLLGELIKEETGSEFVFVTQYPEAKRPFYAKEDPQNPGETLSFDLLFRGVEITTGGERIHDYHEQVAKMKRRGMDPSAFESYLQIHRYGMPPHGGLGLGLERLTGRLLNQNNVRESTLFPRDINRLIP